MIKSQSAETSSGLLLDGWPLIRQGRRILDGLRNVCHVPAVGEKPIGLCVSNRAWRRNSALVMSLYEQHGHER